MIVIVWIERVNGQDITNKLVWGFSLKEAIYRSQSCLESDPCYYVEICEVPARSEDSYGASREVYYARDRAVDRARQINGVSNSIKPGLVWAENNTHYRWWDDIENNKGWIRSEKSVGSLIIGQTLGVSPPV